jgi:hypothetical protein
MANTPSVGGGRGCRRIPIKWLSHLDLKSGGERCGGALMGCYLISGLNVNDRH